MNHSNMTTSAINPRSAVIMEPMFYGLAATVLIGQIFLVNGMVSTWRPIAVLVGEFLGIMAVCGWAPLTTLLGGHRTLQTVDTETVLRSIGARISNVTHILPRNNNDAHDVTDYRDDDSQRAA